MSYSEVYLTSPLCPSVNHYLGWRGVMQNGKPMAVSYCTAEAKKYKSDFADYVKEEIVKQGYKLPLDPKQHFYVDSVFYFDKKNKDCNNYYKCLLDAITDTQTIWVDDNVVCERVQKILYDTDNPRIELYIHPVDYIGVFENASQLDKFESNCFGCKRYKRNCSILQKAKDGRIQNDITGNCCSKYSPISDIEA